jgi:hypothetical protein
MRQYCEIDNHAPANALAGIASTGREMYLPSRYRNRTLVPEITAGEMAGSKLNAGCAKVPLRQRLRGECAVDARRLSRATHAFIPLLLTDVGQVAEEVWPESDNAHENEIDRDQVVENSRHDQNEDTEDQRDERLKREHIDVDMHV